MERLESLGNALSQITLYDIKSVYTQAKNVVLNVSEMEAKVRDATNEEPWGASSTLMQEIAQGTFNFQQFNEIMPCIYARFMEKEARQWRQIYKALQLLEYLVKNGSERVVDDARSHISTLKMLRNFYYIDDKGKDQGINVRNRSRELAELLGDVEKIRGERRKAKANKHKYIGTGNDFGSGSRYGGFGSDSFGSGSYSGGGGSGSYGGGSGSYSGGGGSGSYGGDYSGRDYDSYSGGGGSSGGFRDQASKKPYDEYDAGDDDVASARRSNSISTKTPTSATGLRRSSTLPSASISPPKAKEPEVDLLGMDDDAFTSTVVPPTTNKALPAVISQPALDGDDDFDDFQTAPTSPGVVNTGFLGAAPAPPVLSAPLIAQATSLPPMQPQPMMQPTNLFASSGFGVPAATPTATTMVANRPNYMAATPMGMGQMQPSIFPSQSAMTPSHSRTGSMPGLMSNAITRTGSTPATKPTAAKSNFDDLWSMSLGSTSTASKPAAGGTPSKSIKDLEKEKAQAGIWGAAQQNRPPMGAGFGSFGNVAAPTTSSSSSAGNGLDDLLL